MNLRIDSANRRRLFLHVLPLAVLAAGGWGASPAGAASGDTPPADDDREVRVIVVDDNGVAKVSSGERGKNGTFLGVSLGEDTELSEGGAKVESVVDGSPADEAGIRRGDTIVGFGDSVIRGPARLSEKIHAVSPGEKVQVKLVREGGKKETVTVTMGERPRAHAYWFGDDANAAPLPELEGLGEKLKDLGKDVHVRSFRLPKVFGSDRPRLGVELVETTPELREFLGADREAGVIVGKVIAGMPAEHAGVKVGDVIVAVDGDKIRDAGDLIDHLEDKEGGTVDLELVRDKRTVRLSVTIPKRDDESDEQAGPRAWADSDAVLQELIAEHRKQTAAAREKLAEARTVSAETARALALAEAEARGQVERELARSRAAVGAEELRRRLAEQELEKAAAEADRKRAVELRLKNVI